MNSARRSTLVTDAGGVLELQPNDATRHHHSCTTHNSADTAAATAKVLKSTSSVDLGFYVPTSSGEHDYKKVRTFHVPSHAAWNTIEPTYTKFINDIMEEETLAAMCDYVAKNYPEVGSYQHEEEDDGDGWMRTAARKGLPGPASVLKSMRSRNL
jgi:hypothetical protein